MLCAAACMPVHEVVHGVMLVSRASCSDAESWPALCGMGLAMKRLWGKDRGAAGVRGDSFRGSRGKQVKNTINTH